MEKQKVAWYLQAIIILMLATLFPLGIYLLWKGKLWSRNIRWVVTVLALIIGLVRVTDSFSKAINSNVDESISENTDPRPSQQVGYVDMISKLRKDKDENYGNDYIINEIEQKANIYLEKNISVNGWIGEVDKISGEGNNCYVTINVNYFPDGRSNTYNEDDDGYSVLNKPILFICTVSNNSPCKTLSRGDVVSFSGSTDGEYSWTKSGALDLPEVNFNCSRISKYDKY